MAEEIKPEEASKGKTIVIGKKKLYVAIVAALIVISVAAFFYISPSWKAEYVTADSPVLGSSNATINVVEFSDHECPFCQAAEGFNPQAIANLKSSDPNWQAPVPGIIKNYVNTGKVKLIFRQFPVHQDSSRRLIVNPALASKCAQEQGKFWEYHIILFENYTDLSDISLRRYAMDISLNITQFSDCLTSQKYMNVIQKDLGDGQALGVSGTPTFFIGNDEIGYQKVEGARSFSVFKSVIDSML
jgi:protein-disulfide isomerase